MQGPSPLAGKRVVVTRARSQASELCKLIEARGGVAYEFPVIHIAWPEDLAPLDEAIGRLGEFDWLIFTSTNGAKLFFDRMKHNKVDLDVLGRAKFAVVGPKTAQALEKQGFHADVIAHEFVGEGVADALRDRVRPGQRVLLPRGDLARKALPEALRELGCLVTDVVAYRNEIVTEHADDLVRLLKAGEIDVVTFTSSSTVKNFVSALSGHPLKSLLHGVALAAIGPVTADTVAEFGLTVDVMPPTYTIPDLVDAIVQFLDTQQEGSL
ncbi:MAG: uroporphyrinogen-III synthase [Tumebacillaceae bacterium]